ncbi:MAG: hypothetical protein R3B93_18955 [Bacteroidia bacterium]
MKVYKSLERDPRILGVSLSDARLLIGLFGILIGIVAVVQLLFNTSGVWYLGPFLILIGLYVVLRYGARQNQPNYLISWISFHLLQPKIIDGYEMDIRPKKEKS